MTTTAAGGRITGLLALTLATDVALQVGDFVHLVGNYKVGLADGTKPILGSVGVKSVTRTVTATTYTYPVDTTTGGEVTVEARGLYVKKHNAGATITAGQMVGINSGGALVPANTGVGNVGIALTGGSTGVAIDVLVTTPN